MPRRKDYNTLYLRTYMRKYRNRKKGYDIGNENVELEANDSAENVEFETNDFSARNDLSQSSDSVEQFVFDDSNDFGYEEAVLSSSDTSDGNLPDRHAFQMELSRLISGNNSSRVFVNGLLEILRKNRHTSLPKDSRTLLKTPTTTQKIEECGGTFLHFGIQEGIEKCMLEKVF